LECILPSHLLAFSNGVDTVRSRQDRQAPAAANNCTIDGKAPKQDQLEKTALNFQKGGNPKGFVAVGTVKGGGSPTDVYITSLALTLTLVPLLFTILLKEHKSAAASWYIKKIIPVSIVLVLAIPATSSSSSAPQDISVSVKIQENPSTILVPKRSPNSVETNINQAKQFQLNSVLAIPAKDISLNPVNQENLSTVLVPVQSPHPVETNITQAKQFNLNSIFSQEQSQFLHVGRSILLETESLAVPLVTTYTGLLLHPIGEIMLNLVMGIYLTLHHMRVKIIGFIKNKFEIFKNQVITDSVPNFTYAQWPENPNFVK
jgi:hypothetical protein